MADERDRSYTYDEMAETARRAAAEALAEHTKAQQASAPAPTQDQTFLEQIKNPPRSRSGWSTMPNADDDEETIQAVAKQIRDEATAAVAARKAREGS